MNRLAVASLVLPLALLVACGDSDPEGGAPEPAGTPPETSVDEAGPATTVEPADGITVTPAASVGEEQPEPAIGEVRIWVSNQSFDDDPVHITLHVDDHVVVDDLFLVEGQHNWTAFDVAGLEPGEHEIVAESDTGARTSGEFVVPDGEPRWLVVDYWFEQDAADRYFTINESPEPVAFA